VVASPQLLHDVPGDVSVQREIDHLAGELGVLLPYGPGEPPERAAAAGFTGSRGWTATSPRRQADWLRLERSLIDLRKGFQATSGPTPRHRVARACRGLLEPPHRPASAADRG